MTDGDAFDRRPLNNNDRHDYWRSLNGFSSISSSQVERHEYNSSNTTPPNGFYGIIIFITYNEIALQ